VTDKGSDQGPDGAAAEAWTWLARVRRPQGRKGEVFAELLTDFPEKFSERHHLWLVAEAPQGRGGAAGAHAVIPAAREVELTAHWLHKGGIVLHFAGVDSISAAEQLAGRMVAVPRSERAPIAEDEAYIGDLMGCTVVDVSGAAPVAVGEIEDVDRSAGPVALLVIRGAKGELLVPFAKSYLRKVDLESRRVEMALPEGLLDLNG
jgi:16S rRNA processing protein RimM